MAVSISIDLVALAKEASAIVARLQNPNLVEKMRVLSQGLADLLLQNAALAQEVGRLQHANRILEAQKAALEVRIRDLESANAAMQNPSATAQDEPGKLAVRVLEELFGAPGALPASSLEKRLAVPERQLLVCALERLRAQGYITKHYAAVSIAQPGREFVVAMRRQRP